MYLAYYGHEKLQPLVGEISWAKHLVIPGKCKDPLEREFYNSEDRLVQRTFAEHLEKALGWESIYAYNTETFRRNGTLG